MRLVLSERDGVVEPGVLVDGGVVSAASVVGPESSPQRTMQAVIERFDELREALEGLADETPVPLDQVRLLAPLPRPRTILCCIGNFWEHTARDPTALRMYLKNPDSVIGPDDTVVLPTTRDPWVFMHEAELGIVLRGGVGEVGEEDWSSAVFGYTGVIDVSARGHGRTSWGEFSWLGKSFDTFCPVGPCIVTADEIPEPNDLHVRFWDDGQLRHDYNTSDMEHRVPELVSWASARFPLEAGDLIACGTNHEGLGPLQDGERVELAIDGIGSLRVAVEDPLRRSWERGVYMGADSTNHEARRIHGLAEGGSPR